MPRTLDMPLNDLIGNTKKHGGHHGHFGGRGRGQGPGPARRFVNRHFRTAPYHTQPKMQMGGSMVEEETAVSGGANAEEGTKLYISNLDYGVSNSDIELLFSDIGHVKQHSIHYDRSGRSKGTAEVIFVHHSDALAAIEKYNNVQLDGKPMQIELVGANPVTSVPVPPVTSRLLGKPRVVFQSEQGRVGARGSFHGRGTGGFGLGRGRGQWKKPGEKLEKPSEKKVKKPPREKATAEDLDADLERYHLKAMEFK